MRKLNNIWPFLVVILSIIPLLSLLQPGMFAGHDSESHVARLVSFYQSLSEGNIIPRWAENLNMGFGHPVLMFLYPLSNYIGSFWHAIGFSFIDSVKLTFALAYLLSGIFMYLFVKELINKETAFLAAILYQFAPYRFVDLYVRAALGEHLAFVFMPLVLYAFLKLSRNLNSKNIVLSAVSLALLVLSHNAISLMFMPILFGFTLLLIAYSRNKVLTSYFLLLTYTLGFSLSAFFWMPAFFEGKYTLREVLIAGGYENRFVRFWDMLWGSWNFGGTDTLPKQVGLINWLAIISGLIYIFKVKRRDFNYWLIALCVGYFWTALFLMNGISSPVWKVFKILQNFQFPWRFLTISTLVSSISIISLFLFLKKKKTIILIFVLGIVSIILVISNFRPQGFLKYDDNYFIRDYQGTTDTGESSPRWSIRGMEYRPKARIELIGGKGSINETKRNTTTHIYQVDAVTKIQLLDNTLYFPGWVALVDGVSVTMEYQDLNHPGLMTFYVPEGKHEVKVMFGETKLRIVSDLLSLGSLFLIFAILIWNLRKK